MTVPDSIFVQHMLAIFLALSLGGVITVLAIISPLKRIPGLFDLFFTPFGAFFRKLDKEGKSTKTQGSRGLIACMILVMLGLYLAWMAALLPGSYKVAIDSLAILVIGVRPIGFARLNAAANMMGDEALTTHHIQYRLGQLITRRSIFLMSSVLLCSVFLYLIAGLYGLLPWGFLLAMEEAGKTYNFAQAEKGFWKTPNHLVNIVEKLTNYPAILALSPAITVTLAKSENTSSAMPEAAQKLFPMRGAIATRIAKRSDIAIDIRFLTSNTASDAEIRIRGSGERITLPPEKGAHWLGNPGSRGRLAMRDNKRLIFVHGFLLLLLWIYSAIAIYLGLSN